jgi:hypothetical protein
MRRAPFVAATAIVVLAFVPFFSSTACSSSNDDSGAPDADDDTTPGIDTTPYDAPILDGPEGRVIILNQYDPVNRCWAGKAREVGHPDGLLPDGGLDCKGTGDRCYIMTDGTVLYSPNDCIHGPNFLLKIDNEPYSDLGPCEVPKHLDLSLIKDCPAPSCPFARDVLVDTDVSCAEDIVTLGCRDATPAATSCLCDPSSSTRVFVSFDGKSSPNAPTGFTACDASNPACSKALGIADTVKPCAIPDAGTDAGTDAAPESGADASTDVASDALVDG